MKLRPHPSARLEWFDYPAPSLWRLNRPTDPQIERFDLDWVGEGALIAKPRGAVVMLTLDAPGFAFLEKCYAGASLGQAAVAALEIDAAINFKARIAQFRRKPRSSVAGTMKPVARRWQTFVGTRVIK